MARDKPDQRCTVRTSGRRLFVRRDLLCLLLIFLAALTLRSLYLHQIRSCPFYGHEIMDARFHRQWAEAIAAGQTFMDGPYFRAPLYPWLLGTLYALFGQSDLLPRIVQILAGSLSCGLIYLIGRRAFNWQVGLLAGLAAATYSTFIYFEAELLITWLAVFLDLLLVWLLLVTNDRRSPWLWLLCGAVLGLSAIARPSILIFAPAVVIWLAVLHRSSWRRVVGYAACFLLASALPIAPVAIRNYVVGHDRVPIASSAGLNFFIGNNPQSDGMSAIVPGTPAEWWAGYYAQIERAEQAAGRPLKPSEVSKYYWREALKFMRQQPGAAAALLAKKLGIFWSRWEVSNNQDIRFVTGFAPIVRFLPLTFHVVAPLALLGLIISFGQLRRLFPLWGFVLVYMAGVVAFFVTARYRLPVVPVLIILASRALFWCVDALRAARWPAVATAVVILVPAALLVSRVPPGVEVGMAQTCGSAGIVLAEQSRIDEAEAFLEEALQRYPAQPKVLFWLGLIRMQREDFLSAERYLSQTLALDPQYPEARKHLGLVLARQGKLTDAIDQFTRALVSSPDDPLLHANLARALLETGRTDQGVQALQRSLQLDPGFVRQLAPMARHLIETEQFAAARRVLEEGLARSANDSALLTLLTRVLAGCPDPAQRDLPRAVQVGEQACDLTGWTDPQALDALATAYYAVGRFADAVDTARRALELAKQQDLPSLAAGIEARLGLYQSRLAPPEDP